MLKNLGDEAIDTFYCGVDKSQRWKNNHGNHFNISVDGDRLVLKEEGVHCEFTVQDVKYVNGFCQTFIVCMDLYNPVRLVLVIVILQVRTLWSYLERFA